MGEYAKVLVIPVNLNLRNIDIDCCNSTFMVCCRERLRGCIFLKVGASEVKENTFYERQYSKTFGRSFVDI
jgi:hypothetical protein